MAVVTDALIKQLLAELRKDFERCWRALSAEEQFAILCTVIPSSTASNTYSWLNLWPRVKEWVKGNSRVYESIKTSAVNIGNDKYESTLSIHREDIEDDNLGYLSELPAAQAQALMDWREENVARLLKEGFSTLGFDGQNFFDTDHPLAPNTDGTGTMETQSNIIGNAAAAGDAWFLVDLSKPLKPIIWQERTRPEIVSLTNPNTSDEVFDKDLYSFGLRLRGAWAHTLYHLAQGSKDTLNKTNVDLGIKQMRQMKFDGKVAMGVQPTHIVVSPALEATARELFLAERAAGGASNTLYNRVEVLVNNWLA